MLAERGYRVFAAARRAEDVAALAEAGHEAVPLDLADPASVAAAVETVLGATGGRLYGLFNNAAYGQPGALEDLDREALKAQFEVNLFGTLDLTARVLPAMRAAGAGRVVMNGSVLGRVVIPLRGAYAASKHALEAAADALRMELAGSGVWVSLIQTGPVRTAFRANARAAWARHVRAEESAHRETYRRLAESPAGQGEAPAFSVPPEAVVRALLHALEARRPRARYRVGMPARALVLLQGLLPDRLLDRVLRAMG